MIIISSHSKLKKVKKILQRDIKWCYVGKDISIRENISNVLGKENRFYLKNRLNKIAEEFSQPYLDFVSELGRLQDNKLHWWASRFASKSPYQTDFYLLFCYEVLVSRLIAEFVNKQQNICIFIEDNWLFFSIVTRYKVSENILFLGNCLKIFCDVFLLICRGVIYRILVAGRLFTLWLIAFLYYGNRKPIYVQQGLSTVGIISYAEGRALTSGNFIDYYTGGLSEFLETNNRKVLRPLFLLFPISLIRKIKRLRGTLWPLILDVCITDFLQILKYWKPEINSGKACVIGEFSVRLLLKREILDEFSKTGFNLYLIYHRVLKRFFRKNWCHAITYLFENQPLEKIMCLAARDAGKVKLVGYQHSSVFKFLFSYFFGEGEKEFIPLPDKIIVNGNNAYNILRKEGYPFEKLEIGGAWRYAYLFDEVEKKKNFTNPAKVNLLVLLPVSKHISEFVVEAMIQYYVKNKDIRILIKPHPLMPIEKLNIKQEQIADFKLVNKPLNEIINEFQVALYCNTTAGVESFFYGKIVIRVLLENYIDVDPMAGFDASEIIQCYEDELSEKIDAAVLKAQNPNIDGGRSNPERFFSKVVPSVWLQALDCHTNT